MSGRARAQAPVALAARGRRLLLAGLFLGLLVGRAEPAGAAGPGATPDDLAQQRFREGVEAARQERWVEARAAFEQAYQLARRPVVLVNLAGAQARTGRLLEAARNYRRILDDVASAETAPFRKASAEVLPALEARIPRIRLRPSDLGAGDSVEVDGVALRADQAGAWQPLDPGAHTLVVRRAGAERARVAFSLAEREAHDISLPVAMPPPAALAAAPGALAPAPELALAPDSAHAGLSLRGPEAAVAARPVTRSWWSSPWLWVAVGAGAALATAGVIVLTGEPRGDTYSGNVPPGTVSVR